MRLHRIAGIVVALIVGSEALYPCGGGFYYPIGTPFAGYEGFFSQVLRLDAYYGPERPAELDFLYPLHRAIPPNAVAANPDGVDDAIAPFQAALGRGDLEAATREAHQVVERVLDMAAPSADAYQGPFRRAVEFLELGPLWPRIPRPLIAAFYADTAASESDRWPEPLREAARIRAMSRSAIAAYADSAPGVAAGPLTPVRGAAGIHET